MTKTLDWKKHLTRFGTGFSVVFGVLSFLFIVGAILFYIHPAVLVIVGYGSLIGVLAYVVGVAIEELRSPI